MVDKVLTKTIPTSTEYYGRGRPLTSTEVARCKAVNISATRSWSVVPEGGSENVGRLLEPVSGGYVPHGLVEVR